VPTGIARASDYLIAVLATVVLHVLLFFSLVVLAVWELIAAPSQVVARMPPPDVMVEIRPEMFQRVPEPPAPPENPPTRAVRTTAEQESPVAPDETNLIGERDTLAASELPPDPDGPMGPSQDGEKPRRPDSLETFDSTFQDGPEPDVAVIPMVEEQPPPGDLALKPDEPTPDPTKQQEEMEESPPPGGDPPEKLHTSETRVPVPKLESETEAEPEQERLPKESQSASEAEESKPAGGVPDSVRTKPSEPREPGFRSEVKKKRLRGSIGRRGKSSLDVENTALGRYQAKLSRAIESQWQQNCIRYREHITPGMLTIRFLLDEKGRVSHIKFLDVMEASTIQKGFTMKSIQSADIPTMPKEIVRELDGDPLELIYNFFF
jgi:hypothetical protein